MRTPLPLRPVRILLAVSAAAAGLGVVSCGSGDDTTTLLSVPSDATTDTAVKSADAKNTDVNIAAVIDASDGGCVVDAGPLDDAMIALGRQTVTAHKCPSCHGDTLSGNTDGVPSPTAIGGFAYPPNLTSDPATGLGCWTNEQVEEAMLFGVDDQGMPLCAPMPVFGHLLDGGLDLNQARAVVVYLRSLPVVELQVPGTPDCPALDAGSAPDGADDVSLGATTDAAMDGSPSEDATLQTGGDAALDARADGALGAEAASGPIPDAGLDGGGDLSEESRYGFRQRRRRESRRERRKLGCAIPTSRGACSLGGGDPA